MLTVILPKLRNLNSLIKTITIFISILCIKTNESINSVQDSTSKIVNVLVFIFPGGKSHNFIFRNLFDYTSERMNKEKTGIKYNFDILVHNYDKYIWDNTTYRIFGYGDVDKYKEKFFDLMENSKNDPVLGYNNFNKAMIYFYQEFFQSGILEKLRKTQYEVIMADLNNCLSTFLSLELNIKKKIYMNPTCTYTLFNQVFEYNASYNPIIRYSIYRSHDIF